MIKWTLIYFILGLCASAQANFEVTELQWAVCEPSVTTFLDKSGFAHQEETAYSATYFDTQDLRLLANRTFVRIESKNKNGKIKEKSKVKIGFDSTGQVDQAWLTQHKAKCEFDHYGSQSLPRCAIQNKIKSEDDIWSDDQWEFLRKFRPGLIVDDLKTWGPYSGREIALATGDQEMAMSIDSTSVPGFASPLLELSIRVNSQQSEQASAYWTDRLHRQGVILCPRQVGKFERILSGN